MGPPALLTGIPSQATTIFSYQSEDRGQMTEDRNGIHTQCLFPSAVQSLEHSRDFFVALAPMLPLCFFDISKIEAVTKPDPHLIARSYGYRYIPLELSVRMALFAISFSQVRAYRLRRSANLFRQTAVLFFFGKLLAPPVKLQRNTIGLLKNLKPFKR